MQLFAYVIYGIVVFTWSRNTYYFYLVYFCSVGIMSVLSFVSAKFKTGEVMMLKCWSFRMASRSVLSV